MNCYVCEMVCCFFELIVKVVGVEVWELFELNKVQLLWLIFNKFLCVFLFVIQIGFVDVVFYYMFFKKDFVFFDSDFNRLFMEFLVLVDVSDDLFVQKVFEFRIQYFIVNFCVFCIKIFSSVMSFDEFG